MVTTTQWTLANKPTDSVALSGPNPTYTLDKKELPAPKDGEVLLKLTHLSNDPAQRKWISADAKADRSYTEPPKTGEPMQGIALTEVVESKSPAHKAGDAVLAQIGWTEYAVIPGDQARPAPELPGGLSRTHYLGALGHTGMTAWFGLTDVVKAGKEDVVVVSGAAGATGSMVVQIAKKILGCRRVIAFAGSKEKCSWVESLGADVCLNYKDADFEQQVAKQLPGPDNGGEYASVYFDNVGGAILDLMFKHMAKDGRIAGCGGISGYDDPNAHGLKNYMEVIIMRLMYKGFIVVDYAAQFPEGIDALTKALKEGKLSIEGGETVVKAKFEEVPKTWMSLFSGANTGKLITQIV